MLESEKAKSLLLGYTIFNVNHNVEVKLTDKGRDIYYHKNDWMNKKRNLPNGYFPQVKPKEVDGWFECQLWELMEIFGSHMSMGLDNPFETNIRIKNDQI